MFKKISTWSRWDLHLHTRASNKYKVNDYHGQGISFNDEEVEEFISHIFTDNGPILTVISDHNYFDADQFKKIKSSLKKLSQEKQKDLNVLPGTELDVFFWLDSNDEIVVNINGKDTNLLKKSKTCHCVIILNDDDESKRESIYEEFNKILLRNYNTSEPVLLEYIICDLIDAKLEFIIMPHFTKHKGIENAIPDKSSKGKLLNNNMDQKTNWILSSYFPILDGSKKDFISDKLKEIYQRFKHNNGQSVPIVLTSDNHDYRAYDFNNLSFYKALPTFKGLKLCLTDYDQRIRQSLSNPKNSFISKIELRNLSKTEVVKNVDIELSEDLNCVIGGRSSGKSLLLKEIMFKMGDDKIKKELTKYPKYHDKIKIELYDNDGNIYIGKPEFYSQGSIIEKFNNIKNDALLKDDFKEYFPRIVEHEYFEKRKLETKELIISLNKTFKEIIKLKNHLINKNIYNYLKMESDDETMIFRTSVMKDEIENLRKIVNDLKLYNETLKNIQHYIKNFSEIESKHKDLILMTSKIYEDMCLKFEIYNKLYTISNQFINNVSNEFNVKIKRQQEVIKAINQTSEEIYQYIKMYNHIELLITGIKKHLNNLEKSKSDYSIIGNHKFEIKIKNDLTEDILLEVLTEFIKTQPVKSSRTLNELFRRIMKYGYENYITKNLNNMLDDKINENLRLEYLIYENNELINEMSEGRKVSVFLDILLNKSGSIEPLIIDQPEDDMDNSDIYNILVNTLRKVKSNRQIVIATHDANIVVNGDSENIIYAQKKGKLKIEYENGGIEYEENNINIQKIICDTLEGGEKAFITRANKYDINKIKNKKRGIINAS